MFEHGYVLAMKIAVCVSETGHSYGKVLFSQEPCSAPDKYKRSSDQKTYYAAWINLTHDATHQGGSIFSTFYGCRGGKENHRFIHLHNRNN